MRCPRCLVHTPGLKPRKIKMGTATGPHGGGFYADGGVPTDAERSGLSHNPHLAQSRRESGATLRQYQCPVCEYAWTAEGR